MTVLVEVLTEVLVLSFLEVLMLELICQRWIMHEGFRQCIVRCCQRCWYWGW